MFGFTVVTTSRQTTNKMMAWVIMNYDSKKKSPRLPFGIARRAKKPVLQVNRVRTNELDARVGALGVLAWHGGGVQPHVVLGVLVDGGRSVLLDLDDARGDATDLRRLLLAVQAVSGDGVDRHAGVEFVSTGAKHRCCIPPVKFINSLCK
jgi:hypothetical protein